eukprot:7412044-Ditylum_brightwellii.AAC.1
MKAIVEIEQEDKVIKAEYEKNQDAIKGDRQYSYSEFSNFCNSVTRPYMTTINGVDVTVTGNSENSCAFNSYLWDKIKYILTNSNENGSSKKKSKKRRKLCHGNTSCGDD